MPRSTRATRSFCSTAFLLSVRSWHDMEMRVAACRAAATARASLARVCVMPVTAAPRVPYRRHRLTPSGGRSPSGRPATGRVVAGCNIERAPAYRRCMAAETAWAATVKRACATLTRARPRWTVAGASGRGGASAVQRVAMATSARCDARGGATHPRRARGVCRVQVRRKSGGTATSRVLGRSSAVPGQAQHWRSLPTPVFCRWSSAQAMELASDNRRHASRTRRALSCATANPFGMARTVVVTPPPLPLFASYARRCSRRCCKR